MDHVTPPVLWQPRDDARSLTRLGRYMDGLAASRGLSFEGYDDLWAWSVEDVEGFWGSIWEHFEVGGPTPPDQVLGARAMEPRSWFPGATLSYAAHALRDGPDEGTALVARSQSRGPVELTWAELRDQVARARAGLVRLGVGPGDRVVAFLPNIPETVVAFLATASLGAIWSSCAPEFGTRSVVDRWSQIEPRVLLAVDGYRYGDKAVDKAADVAEIRRSLPGLAATVVLPYLDPDPARVPGALRWDELLAEPGPLEFEPVPFDHPLYVLFSSGTTGLPKPIVHGHGGILLEHLKALALHHDLGPGDRFCWFTTTGWMMWNYLVSGLAVGATLVLFDGDPGWPDLGALWQMVAETGTTFFGTSAPFLLACRKAGIEPAELVDLSALRAVGSTGAPLPPEGFRWVYEHVAPDLPLWSVSGGTDVCSAFVGGAPLVPVWEGEISCRALGAAVTAFDPEGNPLVGEQGELVITQPMPSMPVGLWGDDDGSRYHDAYFAEFPGVWHHGDWITVTERGSCVISGRSDATLNRGGIRVGTAELYSVVEALDEVADSLVVHLEDPAGGPGELLLFVVPAPGVDLDDELVGRIRRALRTELSPRHVPDEVAGVRAVPRTLSGKKLEVPVKRILTGTDPDRAASRGALSDPSALDAYVDLAAERAARTPG
ncbi:MAG: acetoacetate--CoA ligase [Acidimicrobiia bacterium]